MRRAGKGAFAAAIAIAVIFTPVSPTSAHVDQAGDDVAFDIHKKGDGDQHGGNDGHLPAVRNNVDLVSKLRLTTEPGRIADVGEHNGFAYLASYAEPVCQTGGVHVVDVRDVHHPKKVGFISSHTDSYVSEGIHAISVDTKYFTGDLLFYNNEACDKNGIGGVSIVDVTNPAKPKKLVEGAGDFDQPGGSQRTANEIHSVFAWYDAATRKAYAIIVDDEEAADVDILDVTDPSHPKLIKETGLADWPSVVSNGLGNENFHHDLQVRKFGSKWIAMLSYWDAGWVKLDVTDPAHPVFIDDSDFAAEDPEFPGNSPPEGNAHQGDWNRSGEYFVGTDEDFAPYRTTPFAITTGPNTGTYSSVSIGGAASPALLPDKKLNGPTAYVGYACDASKPVPPASSINWGTLQPGEEKIAVVQRGPSGDPDNTEGACFPGEKAANAIEAGYDAVVFVQRHLGSAAQDDDPPFCGSGGFPASPPIVGVCTTHGAFHKIFNTEPHYELPYVAGTEPALGATGERVSIEATFDGWGYIHLLDADTLTDLDTYAIPESKLEENAFGKGALSVHEVEADPNSDELINVAYYAGGYRALKIQDGQLVEVGAFIDEGGNDFWGLDPISVDGQTYVLLSDRDYGLYIVKYTGG
jgi:hypothetical protein